MYKNSKMIVNLHEASKFIKLGKGVRQGDDTMFRKLFIIELKQAFKNSTTDDLEQAKQMPYELEDACSEVGLRMNFSKTKIMINIVTLVKGYRLTSEITM